MMRNVRGVQEFEMIDFLVGALSTPGAAWVGIVLGIVAAFLAWTFLPESIDRASIGGWLIALGFIGGFPRRCRSLC
jgi:hypothetical protein